MSTEIVESAPTTNIIDRIASGAADIVSVVPLETWDDKLEMIAALSSSKPMDDHIDKPIQLVNVVYQPAQSVEIDETGQQHISNYVLTTLIDADGTAFRSGSTTVFNDSRRIIGILGSPLDWPAPLPVKVVQGRNGKNVFHTLVVVAGSKTS